MTIDEIITWLQAKAERPAPPAKVASELSMCNSTGMNAGKYDTLLAGLRLRYYTAPRLQFTPEQEAAIVIATRFGKDAGINAIAFPNLNRHKIALQMISRIMEPSLLNQGGTSLCGPASVVMSMMRNRPLLYAQTVRTLADHGAAPFGTLNLEPRAEIRNYNRTAPAEADWIMCASLRNDSTAVTDALHGVSGPDDMFNWLTGSGYGKVVMLVEYPLRSCKLAPSGILPVDASMSKQNMVRLMADLSSRGWQLFMFAFGDIATAARTLAGQRQSVLDNSGNSAHMAVAQGAFDRSQAAETAGLRTENLSRIQLGWNALTGRGAQHTLHLTYIDRLRISGDNVELTCYNWGSSARWVQLPFDAFVNKFCGFAAAND